MVKMRYEKPDMLVETFVATQSVVAACGESELMNTPKLYVEKNERCCDEDATNCSHYVDPDVIATYDTVEIDNQICIFSTKTGCNEIIYGSDDPVKGVHSLKEISKKIFFNGGNGAWGSEAHPPVIDGIAIASF